MKVKFIIIRKVIAQLWAGASWKYAMAYKKQLERKWVFTQMRALLMSFGYDAIGLTDAALEAGMTRFHKGIKETGISADQYADLSDRMRELARALSKQ